MYRIIIKERKIQNHSSNKDNNLIKTKKKAKEIKNNKLIQNKKILLSKYPLSEKKGKKKTVIWLEQKYLDTISEHYTIYQRLIT